MSEMAATSSTVKSRPDRRVDVGELEALCRPLFCETADKRVEFVIWLNCDQIHADVACALVDVPGSNRIHTHLFVQYAAGVLGTRERRVGSGSQFLRSLQGAAGQRDGESGCTAGRFPGNGRWIPSQRDSQLVLGTSAF